MADHPSTGPRGQEAPPHPLPKADRPDRVIVITRPAAQARSLAERICAAGGQAVVSPWLEILPPQHPDVLPAALEQLSQARLAVFISPNAVHWALSDWLKDHKWPTQVQAMATGEGTAAALAALGITSRMPARHFDSEGLLELPELSANHVCGALVMIFRGETGRELLAEALRQRGAIVRPVPCYRRQVPVESVTTLMNLWDQDRVEGITVTSSEALREFSGRLDVTGLGRLRTTRLFVPHPRIAEVANALGMQKVILTEGGESGLLQGLLAGRPFSV